MCLKSLIKNPSSKIGLPYQKLELRASGKLYPRSRRAPQESDQNPYGFLTPFFVAFRGFFEIGRLLDPKSEIGQSPIECIPLKFLRSDNH